MTGDAGRGCGAVTSLCNLIFRSFPITLTDNNFKELRSNNSNSIFLPVVRYIFSRNSATYLGYLRGTTFTSNFVFFVLPSQVPSASNKSFKSWESRGRSSAKRHNRLIQLWVVPLVYVHISARREVVVNLLEDEAPGYLSP